MSILYTPKGRAREYAPLAVNHYVGCSHGCKYCYVPTIPPWKFKSASRECFHANPQPRKNVIEQLRVDVGKTPGRGQRVILSFTTDPYQHINQDVRLTRDVIRVLHSGGYNVQVLTKGGSRALSDIDIFTNADAFATTMTLLSDDSLDWEPGAASPDDRMKTIEAFHSAGIPTWISLEPVLNPDSALEIIGLTHSFVDLYKIGKINHHTLEARFDWRDFGIRACELCESFGVAYYIKDDLATFFPDFPLGDHRVTVSDIEMAGDRGRIASFPVRQMAFDFG